MIFITLGTQDKPFIRLLKKMEEQLEKGNIKDKVIAQIGPAKFTSKYMEIVDFLDEKTFMKYLNESSLIITHAGVGTILSALKNKKKVLAFPRIKEYKEAINDHQLEICNEFSKNGYILTGNIEDLSHLIAKAANFTPKTFKSNNNNFNKLIKELID